MEEYDREVDREKQIRGEVVNGLEQKGILEHYSDFRSMAITSFLFFVSMFVIGMITIHWFLPFFYKDYELIILGPLDVIKLYVTVSGVIAIGLSIPFMGWQLWKFVCPALTEKERKFTLLYIPGMAIFFVSGLLFGYFIVYPIAYQFLVRLGEIHFSMMITANEYFSFLMLFTLPFGFLFQLPIILMFLTSIDVVNPEQLAKVRKYAYFVITIISVLVTPPDFISDVLMILPLILLYELGLMLSKVVNKRKTEKLYSLEQH